MCGRARNILVIDEDVTEKKITDFLKWAMVSLFKSSWTQSCGWLQESNSQWSVSWYLRCWRTGNTLGVWKVLMVAGPSPPDVTTWTSSL
jgi:hypothetical protein